jgi:hypothetical protein
MGLSERDAELIAASVVGRLKRERRERLWRWGTCALKIVAVASLAASVVALAHGYQLI